MVITYKEDLGMREKCGHGFKLVTGSIAFDSSYPTGGEAMDLSKIFPVDLHMVVIENKSGYYFEYDYTNKKVKVFNALPAHTHAFTGSGLAGHTHTLTGTALAAHAHKVLTVNGAETAGDVTAFVGIKAGAGTAVTGVKVGHAGGGTAIDINSESKTAGTPAGTLDSVSGGTPAGSNAVNVVAVGSEVAAAFNLAALTAVRFMAIGK